MQYRVFYDGQWQEWVDSESQLLQAHDRWRLSNANIRYRIHQNTAHRLWDEQERAESVREYKQGEFNHQEYITSSGGYRTAIFYCHQLAANSQEFQEPDSLQVRLIVSTPPKAEDWGDLWQCDTLNYPTSHGWE